MRGYGLPRNTDVEFPDVGDIRGYGRATHVGTLPNQYGRRDRHGYIRNKDRKAAARRYYKRAARRAGAEMTAAGRDDGY